MDAEMALRWKETRSGGGGRRGGKGLPNTRAEARREKFR